ncbi:MAG: Mfa1 fimbrilin C-terminal domain-containing protein [Muribaculaceae bacterium]|nr:Mfa1 fimbrilin C-terminal domain-containing protein [Muribaculaceae bacterium]
MKLKKFSIFGFAAAMLLGMGSCSNDNSIFDETDKVLDSDESFYANIQICSNGEGTRAYYDDGTEYDGSKDPNFEVGTDKENEINSIYLIFYDADGNRVSTTQVRKDNNANDGEDFKDGLGRVIYKGIVQIDVKHGSKLPAYVMCFVNPITSTNFEINPDFATLESLKATTRPRIIDDNGLFAMSKSVYWGTDRVTGEENQIIVATPLFSEEAGGYATGSKNYQLFTSYEEADKAMKENDKSTVNIYVERYAAKVSLAFENKAKGTTDIELTDDYTLEFTPEYWAVNAYESTTYICKSFLSDAGIDLTFDEMTAALKGSSEKVWTWNNPGFHRCYWAQSPAYYEKAYPRVADDIKENVAGPYALGYYSYQWMEENASENLIAKARKIESGVTSPIYARENTVSGAALAAAAADPNASPKAAIASAVIVGKYELKKKGQKVTTDMFYVMGNATNGYTVFENTNDMRDYFVRTTIKFATNEAGDEFFDYNTGKFKDTYTSFQKYFTVLHPYQASREGLVIDSRFVTIQLTPEAKNAGLYAYLNGKYVEVTDANYNEVNKQMLYAAGTTQGYNEGRVFYNIPIKHLGFYRDHNANAGKTGTESNFDWTKCQSGDFGLVRNHSYSIVVNSIKGLGNGIPDPNDPIVPPTDPEEYFIGARIIVLNWAVVPTQGVDL